MNLNQIAAYQCFGGQQLQYTHKSVVLNCEMRFSIFLPPQANNDEKVPVIYWLSGLTCTDENFVQKAGAQKYAAEHGVAIVAPDTSPRGEGVPDDPDEAYDCGLGAGFYLNATQAPWSTHYQMYDYITQELPSLINENFPIDDNRQSIMGHSMGGHGALTIALKNPDRYQSVSAFSPIVAPMQVPWGQKAFTTYLGSDQAIWQNYDASELLKKASAYLPMLIDQGGADNFLEEQLRPELFIEVSKATGYPVELRMQPGYDHSYFFIASFIGDHISFHAKVLQNKQQT